MQTAVEIAVGLIALIHFGIAFAEMFLWKKPAVFGRLERFHFDEKEAARIAPIVANAGLYNAFLGAGLAWSFIADADAHALRIFFLTCVAIAGVYGAITLKPTTLFIQTLPAVIAGLLMIAA
jgi:putative membrane protein